MRCEDKLPNAMSVPAHVSQPGCVVLTRAQLGQIHPFPHPGRTNRRVCAPASAPAILRLDLAEGHATSSIPKPKCEMNTMRVINMTYRLQGRHGSARNAKDAFQNTQPKNWFAQKNILSAPTNNSRTFSGYKIRILKDISRVKLTGMITLRKI